MILRCFIGVLCIFILGYASSSLRQYISDSQDSATVARLELEAVIEGHGDMGLIPEESDAEPQGSAAAELLAPELAQAEAQPPAPQLRPFRARVVDAMGGAPLAGARIERDGNLLLEADADGSFMLALIEEAAFALCIRADDYGLAYYFVDEPLPDHTGVHTIPLTRAAGLQLSLVDRLGVPRSGVQVVLSARAAELELTSTPSSRNRIHPANPRWEAQSDALGQVQFSGLPSAVPLQAAVWELGFERTDLNNPVVRTASALSPWELPEGCLFCSERPLTLLPQEVRVARWILAEPTSLTAEAGSAANQTPARPALAMTVAPPTSTLPVDFSVTGTSSATLADAVQRALSLRGKLRDESGRAVAGAVLVAQAPAGQAFKTTSAADGAFAFEALGPGEYELTIHAGARFGTRTFGPFQRGEQDLELLLDSGSQVSGRVIDAESGSPQPALLALYASTDLAGRMADVHADAEGRFRLEGLRPGRYQLVATSATGRIALARDVELAPARSVHNLELKLQPGARLRVLCNTGRTIKRLVVLHEEDGIGGIELRNRVEERLLVPAGALRLRLFAGTELVAERTLEIAAGVEELVQFD